MKRFIICLLSIFIFTSCSTMKGMRRDFSVGRNISVKNKTFNEVWKASLKSVRRDFIIVYSDRDKGIIKGKTDNNKLNEYSTSWGQIVGVFIKKTGDNEFKINVQSKEKDKLIMFGTNWENQIISNIEVELY